VGTRTDTSLALVPQSIQVVQRERIEDQTARQIADLDRSISSISFFSYAGVTLRGFRQEIVLCNGLRGDPYAGSSLSQLINTERVEVLKGPAGALDGGGDARGVIKHVTRKPKATPERRIELQAGNNDFQAASTEATGPMSTAGSVRWNADSESVIGDASLAFDVGDTGESTLQFTDITQNLGGNRLRGVPVDDHAAFSPTVAGNTTKPATFSTCTPRLRWRSTASRPAPSWTWMWVRAGSRTTST